MRVRMRTCLVAALALLLLVPAPTRAQDDPRAHLFALINQARLREGFAPLGNSTLLNQAAQRHAEDLASAERRATIGQVTHEGSDGSTYQQRIREARYTAWNDGLMVSEVLWAGLGNAEDALVWFRRRSSTDDEVASDWEVLTDVRYREAGVGFAEDDGVRYFVVVVGSRPGVLPIFINDGSEATESSLIALRLTNEEAVTLGDGASIGRAIEVRMSNRPDFDGVPWQPWEPLLPWQLSSDAPGEYAVYVEFRDGAGRTAVAEDIIRLVSPGELPPTPTPFFDDIESVSELPSSTPPDENGLPTPTPPAAVQPDDDASPLPVLPLTPQPEAAPESLAGTPIAFPTWTPLPTDLPYASEVDGLDWPLLAVFVLQGAALFLGAVAFLRRR
jgi:uncharacterized protein YkwD